MKRKLIYLISVFLVIMLTSCNGKKSDSGTLKTFIYQISADGASLKKVPYEITEDSTKSVVGDMLKQLATVELPIKPVMSGILKKNYAISSVKTIPEKVKLTADPAVLAGITEIKTAPILLDNIEDDVEMQMPLNLPDKVLAETHSVLVKIQLEKPR